MAQQNTQHRSATLRQQQQPQQFALVGQLHNCRVGVLNEGNEKNEGSVMTRNNQFADNQFTISPNPTEGRFDYKDKQGLFTETIDLSDLPQGLYLLHLQLPQKRMTKKVMVVR